MDDYNSSDILFSIPVHENQDIINNQIENISNEKLELVGKIRKIYLESSENERNMFIDPKKYKNDNLFQFIDMNDYNNYSNIILEYWDDLINIFKNKYVINGVKIMASGHIYDIQYVKNMTSSKYYEILHFNGIESLHYLDIFQNSNDKQLFY